MREISCGSITASLYWRAAFDGYVHVRSSCPCPEMKTCRGNRGTVPLIVKVGTKLKRVVNLRPQPLYPRENKKTLGGDVCNCTTSDTIHFTLCVWTRSLWIPYIEAVVCNCTTSDTIHFSLCVWTRSLWTPYIETDVSSHIPENNIENASLYWNRLTILSLWCH